MIRIKSNKKDNNIQFIPHIPKIYLLPFDKFVNTKALYNPNDNINKNVNTDRIIKRSKSYMNHIKSVGGGKPEKILKSSRTISIINIQVLYIYFIESF